MNVRRHLILDNILRFLSTQQKLALTCRTGQNKTKYPVTVSNSNTVQRNSLKLYRKIILLSTLLSVAFMRRSLSMVALGGRNAMKDGI